MLRLHGIMGRADDRAYARQLHALEHRGGIELLFVPPADAGRKRFRLTTDRGTDCAVSLDRDEELDDASALKLGWHAGNLHWRVRFEGDHLVVLLDAPIDTYRARIRPLLDAGEVVERDHV